MSKGQENLIPTNKRSKEEARELGRKGGIASGKARRERKTLKEELVMLLEDDDNNKKISVALLKRALDGDISAFTTIRDTIGEKPTDRIEADVNSEVTITIELSDE